MPSRGSLGFVYAMLGVLIGGVMVLIVIGDNAPWASATIPHSEAGSVPTSSSSEGSIFAVETGVADILTALTPKPTMTPTVRPPTTPTKTPMPYRSPTPTPLPTQAMKGQSAKCCEG